LRADFRHTCEQHELDGYGWEEYDVRTGGRQTIHDPANGVDITTEFVKVPGGSNGGNWGVRIKGIPRDDASPHVRTSFIFYTVLAGDGNLAIQNEKDPMGYEDSIEIQGETAQLGKFSIEVTKGPDGNSHPTHGHPSGLEKPLDRTLARSFVFPEEALWQAKPVLFAHLKSNIDGMLEKYGQENPPPPAQLYTVDNEVGTGNFHAIQKVFEGPFEFDVLFSSESAGEKLTSEKLSLLIPSVSKGISEKFSKVFKPKTPFTKERYEEFSKSLFSNLIGGIGYFYGDSRVDRSYDDAYLEENDGFWEEAEEAKARNTQHLLENPAELFTSIPSRPFFPRGFLWDEGFHLLPIIDWDVDLTLDIVKSWFNLMDEDGWIGREQILGAEARSKVPAEFQVQYPHFANPPTLFFVLSEFLDKLESKHSGSSKNQKPLIPQDYAESLADKDVAMKYLRDLYPLLKRHYFWYRKTQFGDLKSYDREAFSTKEGYRWRGRTPRHILTSGLDDYPRAQPPHPGELHVDLISWIGMMTRSIKRIAETLDESEDAEKFASYENAIVHNIDDLHWNAANATFCDASIDEYEEQYHACHKGYISLFPFMVGFLEPDNKHMGDILNLIGDPEELWSDYGVRSLSKKSEFYGTDENYWRSPIWVNMNYLILRELLVCFSTTVLPLILI
jgi:mannosyl-oligosaccharide glucosidase